MFGQLYVNAQIDKFQSEVGTSKQKADGWYYLADFGIELGPYETKEQADSVGTDLDIMAQESLEADSSDDSTPTPRKSHTPGQRGRERTTRVKADFVEDSPIEPASKMVFDPDDEVQ